MVFPRAICNNIASRPRIFFVRGRRGNTIYTIYIYISHFSLLNFRISHLERYNVLGKVHLRGACVCLGGGKWDI